MNTYQVTEVSDQTRDWNAGSGAAWKSYRVTLRNSTGRELAGVEIARQATAPAPKAGDTVEGTVDQSGKYGPKLQEPRKAGGGGFGRAKSPEERRSIAMQSSNQRGVEIVRIAVDAGAFKPDCLDDVTAAATLAADAFYQRVLKAEATS